MKRFFTSFFIALSLSAPAQSLNAHEKLTKYLAIQHERLGFSGTVFVTQKGQAIFHQHIGMANMTYDIPISEQTVFSIASLSKSFTATLVLQAVAEHTLSLSDTLGKFFPEVSDSAWRSITIDQLLSHRSGIPHNEGIPGYWKEKSTLSYARVPAMKEIFSLKPIHPPGTQAHYSSPGYFILASILENLYRTSFARLLRDKILEPAGLNHTGQLNHQEVIKQLASGYLLTNGQSQIAPYRNYSLMKGSGDLYSSAIDLSTFIEALDQSLLTEPFKNLLFTPHSAQPLSRGDFYGYGWYIREADPDHHKAFYHGGGSFGVSAMMVRYPEEKMTMIILSNRSVMPINELWSDIEKIVFGKNLALPTIRKKEVIDEHMLKQLTGRYVADNHTELHIAESEGKLYAQMQSRPAFEIFRESALQFYGEKVAIDLIFEINSKGIPGRITVLRGSQRHHFYKK